MLFTDASQYECGSLNSQFGCRLVSEPLGFTEALVGRCCALMTVAKHDQAFNILSIVQQCVV